MSFITRILKTVPLQYQSSLLVVPIFNKNQLPLLATRMNTSPFMSVNIFPSITTSTLSSSFIPYRMLSASPNPNAHNGSSKSNKGGNGNKSGYSYNSTPWIVEQVRSQYHRQFGVLSHHAKHKHEGHYATSSSGSGTSKSVKSAPNEGISIGGATITSVSSTISHGAVASTNVSSKHVEDHVPFRDVTLDEILAAKHARLDDVTSVNEEDTVFSAIATMERLGIGAVLVRNQNGQYTGIFSERDYMRKIALRGLSSRTTAVKSVMTPNPVIVPSSATATSVMELMTKKRFRHVPVRHDASGEVVGIVSIGDILATVLREYKDSVSYMRDMITHVPPVEPIITS